MKMKLMIVSRFQIPNFRR
nr:unnamed protein product [Callosobruchus analis]